MCLHSKQSSLFSFYALPSGGKLKGAVVHSAALQLKKKDVFEFKVTYRIIL